MDGGRLTSRGILLSKILYERDRTRLSCQERCDMIWSYLERAFSPSTNEVRIIWHKSHWTPSTSVRVWETAWVLGLVRVRIDSWSRTRILLSFHAEEWNALVEEQFLLGGLLLRSGSSSESRIQ